MLTFLLFMLNFSYSQSIDNCIDSDKYKYEYQMNVASFTLTDLMLTIFAKEDSEIILVYEPKNVKKNIYLKADSIHYEFIPGMFDYSRFVKIPGVYPSDWSTNNIGHVVPVKIYSTEKLLVNAMIINSHCSEVCIGHGITTLLSNVQSGKEYRFSIVENAWVENAWVEAYYNSLLNISSFYNNNKINFTINTAVSTLNKDLILKKGENIVLRIFEELPKISNLEIHAEFPIAVLENTIESYITRRNKNNVCFSNDLLGKEYVLLPVKYNEETYYANGYHYSIRPLKDSTEIYINGLRKGIFNFSDSIYEYSDLPVHIVANKKVTIHQYLEVFYFGSIRPVNPPVFAEQMQVLPTRQMLDSIDFLDTRTTTRSFNFDGSVPIDLINEDTVSSYCNILAYQGDTVYLDGEQISGFTSIIGTQYMYKSQTLNKGYHKLKASKGVLAVVYGNVPYLNSDGKSSSVTFFNYHPDGDWKSDVADILLNGVRYRDYLCYASTFVLSAKAPEETKTFHWTINDTLKAEGKDVDLDLPEAGKYKIKLKLDDDESQVYEWEVTRLEPITTDLDSAIYLCNDSLTYISMNASGGGESKSITWYPANNLKDPTQFHIEFIEPLKTSQTLYYEIVDDNCCSYNDSITINITNVYPHLTATQNNFCKGDSATISLDKEYETIVWNTGETTKDIVVKDAEIYSATVTEGDCTNDTSIEIKVNPLPDFDVKVPNGLLICDGGSEEVEIESDPNISIQWSDNSRVRKRTFSQSGTYTITAKDIKTGCELTKDIVISDMNEIQADILGNPTFCDGESTTLTLNPEGKSYLWNTGETTQSIVVNESGIYSATITSEAGYEITATKEVTKYPLPDFEILGETIICENPVAIYPNKDFANYEWNTGANSKTITITEAGNYWLRVTDENGCETTKSVEIKQANPELNLSTNNINFGEILFGSTKTQTITADRDVIITKNTTKFTVNTSNKDINIIFNPTNIGEFIDTLIVETEGDCKATDTIYITGVCKAEILASVSNATGYPNDNITNKISLELQQQIPLPIDFNYNLTLNINQDAIYITDNTTYSYANGKLVIDIADYLNKSNYQTQIKDIKSRINLARNHENPIKISNFTTDNEFLIPLRKDGNITIYELIENYTPANIQTLNRTTIILNTYESGTYKIEISDLTGKVITKQTQTTKNSEQIKYNYELSTGTYIIKITEPGIIQTIKVIFVE